MNKIIILVVSILTLLLTGILVWYFLFRRKAPGVDCHKQSDWKWSKNCLYIDEKKYDPSLKSPKGISPVLTDFSYSEATKANPIFLPCWYRFRYVNAKTGGYSDFSDWSKSPVISGSCCLPCKDGPGKCAGIEKGFGSCSSNRPVIGVSKEEAEYDPTNEVDGSYIYTNLHRYVGTLDELKPPTEAKSEIIGMFTPSRGKNYYECVDILNNPCPGKGCPTPSMCTGGGDKKCTGNCAVDIYY